jgi:hypothetical protein
MPESKPVKSISIFRIALFFALVLPLLGYAQLMPDSTNILRAFSYYRKATGALRSKDYNGYAIHLKEVNHHLPFHAGILYNLTQALVLSNKNAEALSSLGVLARMSVYYDVARDTVFSSLHEDLQMAEIQKQFELNNRPLITSTRAFELNELDLAAEGMAYDSKTQSFYVSSIHKRKIIQIDSKGDPKDYSVPGDSLLGVYGLKVDTKRRWLWACNIAVPQIRDLAKLKAKPSFLCAYDLETGKLVHKVALSTRGSQVKDLAIGPDGTVYFTDMGENVVYQYRVGTLPQPITRQGVLGDPLGIACSPDGRFLFIADYLQGILRLEIATQHLDLLAPPQGKTLQGIDGLYFHDGTLIATQNGLKPERVIACSLNHPLDKITAIRILESNHPDYAWPTLGVISGNSFFYIANSQWSNFSNSGEIVNTAKSRNTFILKLTL